jgi:hypothetical protein
VDVCITKGIPQDFAVIKSCFDLSSDHSPSLIILTAHELNQEKQLSLSNIHTHWDDFRCLTSLKTEEDIETGVKFLNDSVQWARWNATPEYTDTLKTYDSPILIKQNIEENEDSVEIGTDYEHQKAKDYLTQQSKTR